MATRKKPAQAPAKAPLPPVKTAAVVKKWPASKRREVEWMGDSKKVLKSWPDVVQDALGKQLMKVQFGGEFTPGKFEAVPNIGVGTYEVKTQDKDGWFRIFVVAKFSTAVYVLHSVKKKTNAIAQADIDVAKDRYKQAIVKYNAASAAAKKKEK